MSECDQVIADRLTRHLAGNQAVAAELEGPQSPEGRWRPTAEADSRPSGSDSLEFVPHSSFSASPHGQATLPRARNVNALGIRLFPLAKV